MHSPSFDDFQKELQKVLQIFQGKKQDKVLESQAQRTIDELFKKRKARNKPVVNDEAGIQITGLKLAFDIGRIGIGHYRTAFWPSDRWLVCVGDGNSCVALGYVNGYQLYIQPQEGLPAKLMARHGYGNNYESWCPKLVGMPPTNSVFFVALERAKALGLLKLLQGSENES